MAAVGVVGRVRVVLEEEDVSVDSLLPEPLLGADCELFEDPFASLVMGDDVGDRVALRRGVLGVGPDVQVEARPVHQEHVRAAAP